MLLSCILYSKYKRPHHDPITGKCHGIPIDYDSNLKNITLLSMVELMLAIYSIYLAFQCGKKHLDLFVHVIVAITMPYIYLMYYYFTNCANFTIYKGRT